MVAKTIAVDEAIYESAKNAADEQGTSIEEVVSAYLIKYAESSISQDDAIERFLEIARQSRASSGPGGRTWTRDDIYDRFKTAS